MGLITVVISKVIMLPGQASITAWRRLPAPELLLLMTIGSTIH